MPRNHMVFFKFREITQTSDKENKENWINFVPLHFRREIQIIKTSITERHTVSDEELISCDPKLTFKFS